MSRRDYELESDLDSFWTSLPVDARSDFETTLSVTWSSIENPILKADFLAQFLSISHRRRFERQALEQREREDARWQQLSSAVENLGNTLAAATNANGERQARELSRIGRSVSNVSKVLGKRLEASAPATNRTASEARTMPKFVQSRTMHCVLASGPDNVVDVKLRDDGTEVHVCNLARYAHSRQVSWPAFLREYFLAKQLKQGGCPLPDSKGPIQRHLWYETCALARGTEVTPPEV